MVWILSRGYFELLGPASLIVVIYITEFTILAGRPGLTCPKTDRRWQIGAYLDKTGRIGRPRRAIWQDGGLIFQYGPPQPRTTILQIKFETQSLFTDDQGHPLPLKIPRYYYEYFPRWKWPPGDPLSDLDRRVLVEGNLFELLQWAGAIDYVTGEAKGVLRKELHRELERTLTKASPEYLDRAVDYVVKMSVHSGNLRNQAIQQ